MTISIETESTRIYLNKIENTIKIKLNLTITFELGLAQWLHIIQNQRTPHMYRDRKHFPVAKLKKNEK